MTHTDCYVEDAFVARSIRLQCVVACFDLGAGHRHRWAVLAAVNVALAVRLADFVATAILLPHRDLASEDGAGIDWWGGLVAC
jgi:hypothetical protein